MKKVERNDLSEIGRLKRNEYMRKWSSKNKDKVKANYDSYWSRKAERELQEKQNQEKQDPEKDFDLMLDEVIEEEMSDYDKTAT